MSRRACVGVAIAMLAAGTAAAQPRFRCLPPHDMVFVATLMRDRIATWAACGVDASQTVGEIEVAIEEVLVAIDRLTPEFGATTRPELERFGRYRESVYRRRLAEEPGLCHLPDMVAPPSEYAEAIIAIRAGARREMAPGGAWSQAICEER